MKLIYLIGASGSGKTTAAKKLEEENIVDLQLCYLDSTGVPSHEEMISQYGSGEEWQRVKTLEWTKKIQEKYLSKKYVVFDSQTRPSFIEDAVKEVGIGEYEIVLFDCTDEVRRNRLHHRGQPDLGDEQMMNWAKYLRKECETRGVHIADTTDLTVPACVEVLKKILE